ncbi:MAG: hypothetical protein IJ113_06820 [Eggerthellaceae bacterium]|nr:hypothetical protein [Eggerthellaceae bacterium]
MNIAEALKRTFPMKDLSQGKAASIFASVKSKMPAFVLKNNAPYRAVMTMDDYEILEWAHEYRLTHPGVVWAESLKWESEEDKDDHIALFNRLEATKNSGSLGGKELLDAVQKLAAQQ